jgi:hypothetical protein
LHGSGDRGGLPAQAIALINETAAIGRLDESLEAARGGYASPSPRPRVTIKLKVGMETMGLFPVPSKI